MSMGIKAGGDNRRAHRVGRDLLRSDAGLQRRLQRLIQLDRHVTPDSGMAPHYRWPLYAAP